MNSTSQDAEIQEKIQTPGPRCGQMILEDQPSVTKEKVGLIIERFLKNKDRRLRKLEVQNRVKKGTAKEDMSGQSQLSVSEMIVNDLHIQEEDDKCHVAYTTEETKSLQ